MNDLNCPYCGHAQGVCHDDGFGMDESSLHQDECESCGKLFGFMTAISLDYTAYKADCMNDGQHKYEHTHTHPIQYTRMRCTDCDHERPLSAEEILSVMIKRGKP